MKFRYLIASVTLLVCGLSAFGVPARPGFHSLVGPDGQQIEVEMKGDEHFHYFVDRQGRRLERTSAGSLRFMADADFSLRMAAAAEARKAPVEIERKFPTTGTVRGLVILTEFPDCKFQEGSTREYFDAKINSIGYQGQETFGSVADFFAEQSQGRFSPVFDVVGPVTLSHPASYYARNDLSNFFREICQLADKECDVDFSKYDIDNDGFVDFVFSIFAGYSQAQSLNSSDIWPAMQYLSDYVYDIFDDKYLNVAACASELRGSSGTDLDGIGTICHEFSHILGLPDIYDSGYTGGYGMGHYDIMDVGTYNGDSRIPCGYTAFDRYTLGWLDPVELSGSGFDFELQNLVESGSAAVIVNPADNTEFFTLENRQLVGFDSGLPGHGLIISQINYDPAVWKNNIVNNIQRAGYEHVRLIAANNTKVTDAESGHPFPGEKCVTAFSASTLPAASWVKGGKEFQMPVTNIRETSDGRILFDYGTTAGISTISASSSSSLFEGGARIFSLSGAEVSASAIVPGIYIVLKDGAASKVAVR